MKRLLDDLTVVKLLTRHGVEFVAAATRLSQTRVREIGEQYGHPDRDKLLWAADELARQVEASEKAAIPPSLDGAVVAAAQARARAERIEHVPHARTVPTVIATASNQVEKQEPAMHALATNTPAGTSLTFVAGPQADDAAVLARGESSHNKRTRALAHRIRTELADLRERVAGEESERREIEQRERERLAVEAELAAARKAYEQAQEKARALKGKPSSKPAASTAWDADPKVVRAWAAANGWKVADKGRVPQNVVDAWRAATA